MKLIKISCPACDAPIHIDEDTAWTECPSCGATIHVDDEVQRSEHHITYDNPEEMGYLFEKGRQRAREDVERERPSHDKPEAVTVIVNHTESLTTRMIRFGARWLMRIALITGLAFGIGVKLRSMGRTQSQHESIETAESNDPTATYLHGYEVVDEEVDTPEPSVAIDPSMPAAVTITDENGVVAHVASRPSYEDNAAYISCIESTDDGGTYEVAMPPHTASVVNTLFEQGAIAPQDGDVIIAGYDEGSGNFGTTLALGAALTDETRQVLVTNLSAEGPDMSVIGRDTIDANAGFAISVAPGTSQEIAVPGSYEIHVHPYGTCALLRLIG